MLPSSYTSLTAYLQQFVLPSAPCPAIENKLQAIPKGKKHNWKKWSKIITRQAKRPEFSHLKQTTMINMLTTLMEKECL